MICAHLDDEMDDIIKILTDSTTEKLIDNFHPFYNYSCSVAAVTVAEGPYSAMVLTATLEDGQFFSFYQLN